MKRNPIKKCNQITWQILIALHSAFQVESFSHIFFFMSAIQSPAFAVISARCDLLSDTLAATSAYEILCQIDVKCSVMLFSFFVHGTLNFNLVPPLPVQSCFCFQCFNAVNKYTKLWKGNIQNSSQGKLVWHLFGKWILFRTEKNARTHTHNNNNTQIHHPDGW